MNRNRSTLFLLFTITFAGLSAQQDTTNIEEITVKAYIHEQGILEVPASVGRLDAKDIQQKSINSVLPALNSLSGVRMEERSPGSYRLAIRGSALRSPFGIRNIKVYYDGFPLTDAGGNTYLNLVDQDAIKSIEVLKGPDGSLFGANSGGVLLMESMGEESSFVEVQAGSFDFARASMSVQSGKKSWKYSINQSYQQSSGYREHSFMSRYFLQTKHIWNYARKRSLRFSGFYSKLHYQTPGGLTSEQFEENPRQARPSTPTSPGAIEQNAGVNNSTFFAGLAHDFYILPSLKHVIQVSGIFTAFENPFITNYETRAENAYALRTFLEWKNRDSMRVQMQLNAGIEWLGQDTRISNYQNIAGEKGDLQEADQIVSQAGFGFLQWNLRSGRFSSTLSSSINLNRYTYAPLPGSAGISGTKEFTPEIMPRLAISYLFTQALSARMIISRGYSTPTIGEVRASGTGLNPNLEAEKGYNFELGLRRYNKSKTFYADLAAFYFRLNGAIVRRVNALDREYFVNAGGTEQAGLEAELNYRIISQKTGFIRRLEWKEALSIYSFRFTDYGPANVYSGNELTGVPAEVIVSSLSTELAGGFYTFLRYQYTSEIPLNDANTAYSKAYQLLQLKLGYRFSVNKRFGMEIFAGGDNLLNESYSLGNDTNAFGGRYYNPAAGRNFFVGVRGKF